MKQQHIIWSDDFGQIESIAKDIREENPDYSDTDALNEAYVINGEYLEDERYNLNIPTENEIVVIADLGLWHGRRSGYKVLNEKNIRTCLYAEYADTDYATWYVDEKGDLLCTASHHDGTNYYRYREFKKNVSESRKRAFLDAIYKGTVTEEEIVRVTKRLGPKIAKVYGWKVA